MAAESTMTLQRSFHQGVIEEIHSHGMLHESFKSNLATLWLMDYDIQKTTQKIIQGEFSIKTITQKNNPIFITACKVREIHWPVTKDAPIIRVGRRSFAFAIPGVLYGLQFAPNCPDIILCEIEELFQTLANYQDLRESKTGVNLCALPESEEEFWQMSRYEIEKVANFKLVQCGHYGSRSISTAMTGQSSCISRLYRVSTLILSLTKWMLTGSIGPMHVTIYNMQVNNNGRIDKRASARASVYTDVVDAMEMKKSLPKDSLSLKLLDMNQDNKLSAQVLGFEVWTLNKQSLNDLANILLQDEEQHIIARGSGSSGVNKGDHAGAGN